MAEWVSGTSSAMEKWVENKSNIFCQFFAILDDFSKWGTLMAKWNFEKSSNMAKIEERGWYFNQ